MTSRSRLTQKATPRYLRRVPRRGGGSSATTIAVTNGIQTSAESRKLKLMMLAPNESGEGVAVALGATLGNTEGATLGTGLGVGLDCSSRCNSAITASPRCPPGRGRRRARRQPARRRSARPAGSAGGSERGAESAAGRQTPGPAAGAARAAARGAQTAPATTRQAWRVRRCARKTPNASRRWAASVSARRRATATVPTARPARTGAHQTIRVQSGGDPGTSCTRNRSQYQTNVRSTPITPRTARTAVTRAAPERTSMRREASKARRAGTAPSAAPAQARASAAATRSRQRAGPIQAADG